MDHLVFLWYEVFQTKCNPCLIHLNEGTGIVDEQRKGQEETHTHTYISPFPAYPVSSKRISLW